MKKGYDLGPFAHLQRHKTHFQSSKAGRQQPTGCLSTKVMVYGRKQPRVIGLADSQTTTKKKCERQGSGPPSDVDFWWD